MDQGLKERLVGAAVLVAIGVWLIPWVLDGPENPSENSTSSLQLPAAEEPVPMRTQTLRIGSPAEQQAAAPAAPQPEPSAAAPAAPESPAAAPEPAANSETEVAVATATPEPATVAPAPATPATPAPRPAATPAPAPRPPAAPATAAKGDWVVQLGSFGAEDNARKLAQRADQFGYKASVSSTRANGRTLYRVRVGPYETRRSADAAASALAAHDLKGQVVAAD
jgi:DedD protein